jgi:SAM-dependent methyltransferase
VAWPDGFQCLDYEDATKYLSEVHTLLKPGGVLIASMPDLSKIGKVALDDKINIDIRIDAIRCLYTPPHSILENVKFVYTPILFIEILNKIGFGFCHQVGRPNQLIRMFGGGYHQGSKFHLKSHMYFVILAEKLI